MKKKLLLLLCLVLAGIGQMRAQIAAGDYFIQNVGYEGYLNGANSYGTKASLTKHGQKMTIAVSGEGYTINTHISNGSGKNFLAAGDNTYVDAVSAVHTITDLGDGTFSIKDTNNKYLVAGEDGIVNFKADEVTDAAKWKFVTMDDVKSMLSEATSDNPVDATFFIGDANFSRNNQYFDLWKGDKPSKGGDQANMNAEKWGGNSQTFDSYQELTGLPNGLYILKAQGFYRYNNTNDNTNDVAAAAHADGTEVINSYLYANNAKVALKSIADGEAVESYGKMPFSQTEASEAFKKDLYNNTLTAIVSDGTLKVGVKKTNHLGTDWTIWDNFELYYYGALIANPNFVSNDNGWDKDGNVAWKNGNTYTGPDGAVGIIEMGKWNASTGQTFDDKISQTINDLPNGYYRIKAGLQSASNVYMTLFANEQATQYLSHGDTNGNTGKKGWDWVEVITYVNDGTLTFGATAKANNAKQAWANCDMFSLEYLGLDLPENSDVTCYLSNPSFEGGNMDGWTVENNGGDWTPMTRSNAGDPKSGRYWYEKYKFSGKIDVNQTVSGLPAGHYRLSVLAVDQSNQTKLIAETATNSNETVIKTEPSDRYTVDIFVNEGEDLKLGLYCENHPANKWVGFDDFRLTYLSSEFAALEPLEGAMNADAKSDMLSKIETYNSDKNMDNLKAAWNAMAVAKASINAYTKARYYLDEAQDAKATTFTTSSADDYATAVADLETKYTNGEFTDAQATSYSYLIGDHTSGVVPAYMLGGWDNTKIYINTWSDEGDTDGSNFKAPFYEYWVADANSLGNREITGTITGLDNGTYSITALVRIRAKNGVLSTEATGITMSANGGEAVDVTEGNQIGTSQLSMAEFAAKGVVTDGTLSLTFNVADANISWLAFKNVKYSRIESDEDIQAFKDAIAAAETSYPLGFQKGEYAPYKNVAAAQALAAAKAIDTEKPVAFGTLPTLKEALETATWTANADEVNAFYSLSNYTAESDKDESNRVYALGWNKADRTDAYNTRIMIAPDASNVGLTSNALFTKYNTSYGTEDGYTMPLAASTLYKLTFDYAGWGNSPTTNIVVKDANGQAQTLSVSSYKPATNDGNSNAEHWYSFEAYFVTGEAGNYTIELNKVDGGQQQTVLANMELKTSDPIEQEFKITSAGWATLVTDLSKTTKPEAVTVYEVTAGAEDTDVTLSEVDNIEPNKPYLISGESSTYSIFGCPVAKDATPTNGLLVGNWNAGATITGDGSQYLLQKHDSRVAFYLLANDATAKLAANSAYLKKETTSPVKAFYFDGLGDETAISALEALTSGNAKIYDLNGRQIQKLQKGVNIVNGKKIIVK